MSFMAMYSLEASRRTVYGVSVCDLDWNSTLSFVNELTFVSHAQTVIAFLSSEKAKRLSRDPGYRAALSHQLVFPEGKGMDDASQAAHGVKFPMTTNSEDFVPALLTYMDVPKRVGLIGADALMVENAAEALSRHAPWHSFIALPTANAADETTYSKHNQLQNLKLDVVLIAMETPEQEKWALTHLRMEDARLVIAVGS